MRRAERPKQPGIENGTSRSVLNELAAPCHLTVPSASLRVEHVVEPERQYVLRETFIDLTAEKTYHNLRFNSFTI